MQLKAQGKSVSGQAQNPGNLVLSAASTIPSPTFLQGNETIDKWFHQQGYLKVKISNEPSVPTSQPQRDIHGSVEEKL